MNTALNRTVITILTNKSGGALALGDVVIIDTANSSAVTTTNTADYITTFPGVVMEPNGIANNEQGQIAFVGYVNQINLTTSASIGDKIATSTTYKKGVPNASLSVGTFGIALEVGTTPKALLIGLMGYGGTSAGVIPETFNAKMVLATGTANTDVYSGTNLFVQPYNGENISVYNTGTTAWETLTISNTIVVPFAGLTSGTNYDVFIYKSGTTGVIDYLGWTNNTTRAQELAYQNNIEVHPTHKNKRYIGTIRTTAANKCDDAPKRRFLWNNYNRIEKKLLVVENADWIIASNTWTPANANLNNRVELIVGKADTQLDLIAYMPITQYGGIVTIGNGISEDAINTITTDLFGGIASGWGTAGDARLIKQISIGYHYYQWVQRTDGGATVNFYSGAGVASGLLGYIKG